MVGAQVHRTKILIITFMTVQPKGYRRHSLSECRDHDTWIPFSVFFFFFLKPKRIGGTTGVLSGGLREKNKATRVSLEGRIRLLFIYLLCDFIGKFLEMESELMGSFKIINFWV